MPSYSVLAVTPITNDWQARYIEEASAIVAAYGGKYIARTSNHETLEGDGEEAALRIIIAWPSTQVAKTFMADPAYLPLLKARTQGSVSHHVLIEGMDDLA
jgi:uncharacterized protein (DUF1330 family)